MDVIKIMPCLDMKDGPYYRTYRWDTKKNGIAVVKDWIPIEIR